MKEFNLNCPICGVEPERARLCVVSGRFQAREMFLSESGFSPVDAKGFDTSEEDVECWSCGATFPIETCYNRGSLFRSETIDVRDLKEEKNGVLSAQTLLFGTPLHVTLIRVKRNDLGIQMADGHPLATDRYNELCALDQRGAFHTTELPGREGEWVMFMHPHSMG